MIKKIKREFTAEGHEAWLKLRDGFIGGSDASSIVGLNPYASAFSVWAEKLGKVERFSGNLQTEVGTYLEDFVAQKWAEQNGKKVRKNNYSMVNDSYPFAIADIDREVVGEDAGLECKTISALSESKFKGGEFPPYYYVQCVHYLAVTGKARWYLAVLIGNHDFKTYVIERDENEIKALMDAEAEFYSHLKDGTPPPVDGSSATSSTIGKLYPTSDSDGSLDLCELEQTMKDYSELGARIKELEAERDEKANIVKEFMKEAESGESYSYKVRFNTTKKETFDSKKFRKDHESMDLSSYLKTSTYRTLKITEKEIKQ